MDKIYLSFNHYALGCHALAPFHIIIIVFELANFCFVLLVFLQFVCIFHSVVRGCVFRYDSGLY